MSDFKVLWEAIVCEDLARLERLLDEGADATSCARDGFTLLMHALLAGDADPAVVKLLIKRGADVNAVEPGQKHTALHFAARDQRRQAVLLLLKAGANVNAQDVFGCTPLIRAVMHAKPDAHIIKALMRYGADPRKKNKARKSPIDIAIQTGDERSLAWLRPG